MVSSVTSLTGNGVRDWLLQRLTAIFIGAYSVFLVAYIIIHPNLNYAQWSGLFQSPLMQVTNTLLALSIMVHAWIGIWTVTTDYLKKTCVRLSVQVLVLLFLLGLFVWALKIFWSM